MISHPNTKINLGLNVLRRRPDGYHDIETVFVPYFGLQDTLEIVRGDDYSTTLAGLVEKYGRKGGCVEVKENGCEDNDGVERLRQGITADGKCMITVAREEGVDWDPVGDLCVKAYNALDADYGLPPVKIYLEKIAPVGAGLGGGSADAAFTLRMLSEMFTLGLDDDMLARYAASLGSDCAFFVWNRPMLGQGRGEILSPVDLPQLDACELQVVVPPGIHVSTAEAYRGIVPRENSSSGPDAGSGVPSCMTLTEALQHPIAEWRNLVENDFERTVFAKYPGLAAVKRSLYDAGAVYASMSGSGSALYGIFH